jgi:hypothetical protein
MRQLGGGGIHGHGLQAQAAEDDMLPTDSSRSDTGEHTTWLPWIPVVVPLLALLPTLAAYVIGWGALAGTH